MSRRSAGSRRAYKAPTIRRYPLSDDQIAEYNVASGGSNVRKCDTRECGGATSGGSSGAHGRAMDMPAWLEP